MLASLVCVERWVGNDAGKRFFLADRHGSMQGEVRRPPAAFSGAASERLPDFFTITELTFVRFRGYYPHRHEQGSKHPNSEES
jgi:hypothetical protein